MFADNTLLDLILKGSVLTFMGMIWVILLVRVTGLRAFSKMTNFDFVMTVAVGSLLAGAGQASSWSSFAQVLVALSSLFLIQFIAARLRQSSSTFESAIQNQPVLLMKNGLVLDHALEATRVSKSDLIAKLREANVLDLTQVRAVVLETTGDVSVLHGQHCSSELLEGVTEVKQKEAHS